MDDSKPRPSVAARRPGLRGIWLIVLAGWLLLGVLGGLAIQREGEREIDERAARLLETANYALASREAELARIARILAHDDRVRSILSQARAMVALEGGGGGGEGAARLRRELAHAVTPIATELIHGDDRVLQFHLGPEAVSFLRVHAPDRFGDELASLRPLLTTVYRSGKGAMGFEIGRVYSGFRAVEPVWAPDPGGASRVVGTVEVGTGIAPIDAYLASRLQARAALLLPVGLVEENIWAEIREQRNVVPVGSGDYYLDGPAIEHPGLAAALKRIDSHPPSYWRFATDEGRWLAVSRPVPVVEQNGDVVARLVAVESVTDLYDTMQTRLLAWTTGVIAAIALTTLALWLLSRWQRTRWMVVIDQAETERDALFELSPQPVELTDMQGRSLLSNESYRRTFGPREPDEVVGWHRRGLTGLQLAAFEAAITVGERWNGALKLPALHGDDGWFRVQVVPIPDQSGQPARLWWFYQDIDRERRAAAVAQAGRERLDAFLAASPAVVYTFLVDRPDRLEYVSANIRDILGYTPDALIDGPDWWEQALHPEDRERVAAERDFTRWQDDHKRSRYRLLRPDDSNGSTLWVTDHARLLRDASGRPERVVGALIDSREVVALESRLAESEALYRTITEGVEESIFLLQVEPDGGFRFIASNPAHEQSTGLSRQAMAGATPEELLSPAVASQVMAQYRRCLEAGETIRYEETLDLPAGRHDWRTTLTPLRDESGRITLMVGIATRRSSEQ